MNRSLWKPLLGLAGLAISAGPSFADDPLTTPKQPGKVIKSDAEWQRILTPEQFAVTRMAATEPAGSGKLLHNHAQGVYECVCCDAPLFSSKTKFDSGTGWPSFYAPVARASVNTATDYKLGYPRTEVVCNTCGAHLGHVFGDGPPPTGMRFCMNSVALKFAKNSPQASKPHPTANPRSDADPKTDADRTPPK